MKATTSQQPSGPRAGEVLLEARGVTSGYGQMPVVRDLDLPIVAGEVAALIGPNGAGKTTTLLTLAGELPTMSTDLLVVRSRRSATSDLSRVASMARF